MWWRVRATLPDRPGALAALAQRCGGAGVNILGLQIFPGVEEVTDELVLRTPDGWAEAEVAALLESAGGGGVVVQRSTEAALADQPTRYVQAARTVLAQPASFPEVVARLFDAEPEPDPGAGIVQDVMEMTVGDVGVQVHRTAPFTATEHARGAAMADLVSDVLERSRAQAVSPNPGRRVGTGASPAYVVEGETVSAVVEGVAVGVATLRPELDGDGARPVTLRVDPAWQRRGIGTRLLLDVARLACTHGAREVLLTTRSDNRAVLPMVMAAGLRGRIRMAADTLSVRIPVGDLRPLRL